MKITPQHYFLLPQLPLLARPLQPAAPPQRVTQLLLQAVRWDNSRHLCERPTFDLCQARTTPRWARLPQNKPQRLHFTFGFKVGSKLRTGALAKQSANQYGYLIGVNCVPMLRVVLKVRVGHERQIIQHHEPFFAYAGSHLI